MLFLAAALRRTASVSGTIRSQWHHKHRWPALIWQQRGAWAGWRSWTARGRGSLSQKQQKETKTPGRVTLDHRSEPPQPDGLLWGLRPRRRTTFPLTCSTSPLNCKWINRAADSERMKQRGPLSVILIAFLMTKPASHTRLLIDIQLLRVCGCVCVCADVL